jgi:hypothetical protein
MESYNVMVSKEKVLRVIEYFRTNRTINEIKEDKRIVKLLVELGVLKSIGRVLSLDKNFRAIHTLVEVYDEEEPRISVKSVIFDRLREERDNIYIIWKSHMAEPIPVVEDGKFTIRQVSPLPISELYTITAIQFNNPVLKFRFITRDEREILFNVTNLPYYIIIPPSGKPFKKMTSEERVKAPVTFFFFYSK